MLITLESARINAGLTQRQASKKLKISVPTLSKYEKDSSNISKELFDRMSELYSVESQDDLYIGSRKVYLQRLHQWKHKK